MDFLRDNGYGNEKKLMQAIEAMKKTKPSKGKAIVEYVR